MNRRDFLAVLAVLPTFLDATFAYAVTPGGPDAKEWFTAIEGKLSSEEIEKTRQHLLNPTFLKSKDFEREVVRQFDEGLTLEVNAWILSRIECAVIYLKLKSAYAL